MHSLLDWYIIIKNINRFIDSQMIWFISTLDNFENGMLVSFSVSIVSINLSTKMKLYARGYQRGYTSGSWLSEDQGMGDQELCGQMLFRGIASTWDLDGSVGRDCSSKLYCLENSHQLNSLCRFARCWLVGRCLVDRWLLQGWWPMQRGMTPMILHICITLEFHNLCNVNIFDTLNVPSSISIPRCQCLWSTNLSLHPVILSYY